MNEDKYKDSTRNNNRFLLGSKVSRARSGLRFQLYRRHFVKPW